ncbi:MAG: hypothetical protein ACRC8Y_17190 [Chroococcales cyanobacterium]
MSYVLCHWSWVDGVHVRSNDFSRYRVTKASAFVTRSKDGEDGVHVRSNDFSRYRVTKASAFVTRSKEAIAPVPKQVLNPKRVSVMASAMTQEQRLKSLLQT